MNDLDDLFDGVSSAQNVKYEEGFAEGERNGKKTAFVNGMKIGQNSAFSLCYEMGHYLGACEFYLENGNPESSDKGFKLAKQISEQICSFDLTDCHNESFILRLNLIRGKFKQFCSITNTANYFNKPCLNPTSNLNF